MPLAGEAYAQAVPPAGVLAGVLAGDALAHAAPPLARAAIVLAYIYALGLDYTADPVE